MSSRATALVQLAPETYEFEEFPLPHLPEGSALVRIEANGMCGSDAESHLGQDPAFTAGDMTRFPRINGHEIVGVIEDMGPTTPSRRGFAVGDRVAVNPYIPCGRCKACLRGEAQMCRSNRFSPAVYGFIPTRHQPSLWGGYSTHVYIDPAAVLYPVPSSLDPLTATRWNPLGGALQWGVLSPDLRPGDSILVLGTGQRGVAAVAAARLSGAGMVVATGLTKDRHKLDLALEFGADAVVDVEKESLVEVVMELTGGEGVDIVLDTTPHATSTLRDAVACVRRGGTVVNAGIKPSTMDAFPIRDFTSRNIRLLGQSGQPDAAYRRAMAMLAGGALPFERMRTHVFGFDQFEDALETLLGLTPEPALNVVVVPEFRRQ